MAVASAHMASRERDREVTSNNSLVPRGIAGAGDIPGPCLLSRLSMIRNTAVGDTCGDSEPMPFAVGRANPRFAARPSHRWRLLRPPGLTTIRSRRWTQTP